MGDRIARIFGIQVMRGPATLSVQLELDTGCRRAALFASETEASKPALCETRTYSAPSDGLWVSQAVRRFPNGESRPLRRAIDDPDLEELELWEFGQGKIKWAHYVSEWTLDYLNRAQKRNRLSMRKIEAAIGPAEVIPQCVEQTLQSVSVFYRRHNLLMSYSSRPDIAPFESQLCSTRTFLVQN